MFARIEVFDQQLPTGKDLLASRASLRAEPVGQSSIPHHFCQASGVPLLAARSFTVTPFAGVFSLPVEVMADWTEWGCVGERNRGTRSFGWRRTSSLRLRAMCSIAS
jgi:hypothetical protein